MKAKKIIITLAFALLMFGLKAQDQYEYASVAYLVVSTAPTKYNITISKEGKYEASEGKVSQGNSFSNYTPVIELLNKMSKEGWEVFNSSMNAGERYFLLRKKK